MQDNFNDDVSMHASVFKYSQTTINRSSSVVDLEVLKLERANVKMAPFLHQKRGLWSDWSKGGGGGVLSCTNDTGIMQFFLPTSGLASPVAGLSCPP